MAVEGNVGLAFALVVAAGMCTCLGATLVFCTSVANHRVLSAALGASAGVMLYVSFAEIFTAKAVVAFTDAGYSDAEAMRYATFSFFTGVVATWLLGKLVHCLAHVQQRISNCRGRRSTPASSCIPAAAAQLKPTSTDMEAGLVPPTTPPALSTVQVAGTSSEFARATAATVAMSGASSPASVKDAEVLVAPGPAEMDGSVRSGCSCCSSGHMSAGGCNCCDNSRPALELDIPKEENPALVAVLQVDHHMTDLARMGMLTGLAVGLHNLPEGLATFMATLASPVAGISIAVAIALHNIPEGVVVAMPIYYATGSKWKGLIWSLISGLAEPVGGLLAYAVLAGNGMNPLAFAIMFGFVAGMMVYISVRELLPTALRYDPEDRYATAACFWGMVVMAASLLLFRV